jgi:activator of 2-hydroxyglutaryl-CoA dehydratase
MNDKCAGGTGAVIDKVNAKLKIPADQLCKQGYHGHQAAPGRRQVRCVRRDRHQRLQKLGVPSNELMASLFESIIQQNLSVLTRGHTLMPYVLLLGGPNTYIQGMVECWKANIPPIWAERGVELPPCDDPADLIIVPQQRPVLRGARRRRVRQDEDDNVGVYTGTAKLEWYLTEGRIAEKKKAGGAGLSKDADELARLHERVPADQVHPQDLPAGQGRARLPRHRRRQHLEKAVLIDEAGDRGQEGLPAVEGQPDRRHQGAARRPARRRSRAQGATLTILGVGTTGYAKDILRDVLRADAAIVETVAHCESALHFYDNVDVVCDVGGQDIKIIILKNGKVKDFKLNTQCSAGNGYFLQSTADGLRPRRPRLRQAGAFAAQAMPSFGYGCAVFMQSDIVDFQRQGWAPEEIMAGLANVLPKNIWLYVSADPEPGQARPALRAAGRHPAQPGGREERRSTSSRSASRPRASRPM